MSEQDLLLIRRAKAGDASAYDELYQNYYHFVYRYAHSLAHNEADARDITQEVFLQLYKSLPSLRDETLFVPWLRKIIHSKSQMIFRKNKDTLYESEQIASELGKEIRTEFVPHDYMDDMSDKEILRDLMAQLSEKRRAVLDMFYFQQLSLDEISQAMDINVNTVKGRLFEARKALLKEVNAFEAKEGRKISFRIDPLPTVGLMGILYELRELLFHGGLYHLIQAAMVVIFTISTGLAIRESYVPHSATDETKELEISKDAKLPFHPLIYQKQRIDSANDAYFIILDFAKSKDLLQDKSKQDLREIQPVVNELCASDNAYCETLRNNGWLNEFETLMN